jgi:hypothetical protein
LVIKLSSNKTTTASCGWTASVRYV